MAAGWLVLLRRTRSRLVCDATPPQVNDPDDKMGGIDYLRLDKTKDKAYQFDAAFGPECTSEDVYAVVIEFR